MKSLFLQFFVTLSLFSTVALAKNQGGNGSGGGAGIVCRNDDGTVTEAYLYDLYETENDPNIEIQIVRSNEPPEIQIENILKRWHDLEEKHWSFMSSINYARFEDVSLMRKALALVERDWVFLKEGVTLPLNTDIVPQFLPANKKCKLESIALYDDTKRVLYVDKSVYLKLSPTDQAALKVHEAVYKGRRVLLNENTSTNTRLSTARFFSQEFSEKYTQFSDIIPPKCETCEEPKVRAKTEFETREEYMTDIDVKEIELMLGNKKLVCQNGTDSWSYFIGNTNQNKTQNMMIGMPTEKSHEVPYYGNAAQFEIKMFKTNYGTTYLAIRGLGWGNQLDFQISVPITRYQQEIDREEIYAGLKQIDGVISTNLEHEAYQDDNRDLKLLSKKSTQTSCVLK